MSIDLSELEVTLRDSSDTAGDHLWIAANVVREFRDNGVADPVPEHIQDQILKSQLLAIVSSVESYHKNRTPIDYTIHLVFTLILLSDRNIISDARKKLKETIQLIDEPLRTAVSEHIDKAYQFMKGQGLLKEFRDE